MRRAERRPVRERARRRGDAAVRGFTLIEVVTVSAVVGVLTLLIAQALADLFRSQAYTRGQARLTEVCDRIMRSIANDLAFATRVFTDGADGDAYLAALAYPASAVAPDSRLPALTQRGYFDVDPEAQLETGNMLLAGQLAGTVHVEIAAASTGELLEGLTGVLAGGESAPPRRLRIDTFRFVLYYPTRATSGELDLARWGSARLVSRNDVEAIADEPGRTEALRELYAQGFRWAWSPRSSAGAGLRRITAFGTLVALEPAQKVPVDAAQVATDLAATRHCRVAANGEIGRLRVPKYAKALRAGFPGGFEVKIDGPSTGKLVLVRLVLRAGGGTSTDNGAEVVRLVSCRDG